MESKYFALILALDKGRECFGSGRMHACVEPANARVIEEDDIYRPIAQLGMLIRSGNNIFHVHPSEMYFA